MRKPTHQQPRRTGRRLSLALVTAGMTMMALVALTAAPAHAATPTSTPTVTAVSVSKQVADLDAGLTPAQLVELRKLSATGGAPIGTLAQGGFDRDHYWFKISTAEVVGVGVGVACRAAFPGVGWFVCPPIAAAVQWAVGQWPGAGGFWAELYTSGRVRVGTW